MVMRWSEDDLIKIITDEEDLSPAERVLLARVLDILKRVGEVPPPNDKGGRKISATCTEGINLRTRPRR